VVITVKDHQIVARIPQESPFCPNIAVTPDGEQVWFTLKDVGKTMVFSGRPPFAVLKILATGPITNHVKVVRNSRGTFAYVTVGGLNQVQVFRTDDFSKVTTIPVGKLPHGVWESGDGTRVYVGLENDDRLVAINTQTNQVVATIPIGQAPQAVIYVSDAVPTGAGTEGLQLLGVAGEATHITIAAPGGSQPTSVSLFDQGLIQVLQAAVTGLEPGKPYVLALARRRDGRAPLEPLAAFTTNPAGAAVVDAIGPIRQIVRASTPAERRYLVIAAGTPAQPGPVVQTQVD
jgi:YVTN family beta-propeller protein